MKNKKKLDFLKKNESKMDFQEAINSLSQNESNNTQVILLFDFLPPTLLPSKRKKALIGNLSFSRIIVHKYQPY